MDLGDIKDTYFIECGELMTELETGLHELSDNGPDTDTINSIFRAVHSMKGGGGAFGLNEIVSFSHVFENALDLCRNDISQLTDDRLQVLFRAMDVLSDIVNASRVGETPPEGTELIEELETAFGLSSHGEEAEPEVEFEPVAIGIMDLGLGEEAEEAGKPEFKIHFAPQAGMYLKGHDPIRVFRELSELGDMTVTCHESDLPSLNELSPAESYFKWDITLATDAMESAIDEIFEWVKEDATLTIQAPEISADADMDIAFPDEVATEGLGAEDPFEDIPSSGVSEEEDEPQAAIEATDVAQDVAAEEEAAPSNVQELHPAKKEEEPAADAAKKPAKAKQEANKPVRTIRVDSEKVDRLINLMGELVIHEAMVAECVKNAGFNSASPTGLALVGLQNLTREIQNGVMAIRTQPVKPVFMRLSRVVREVCSATGKRVDLVVDGESTEVDTSVIEGLTDPLTHMIRNSVDHGVEDAETRRAVGKKENGTVQVRAYHSSGRIVIDVIDDGAGINREKVLGKAIEKGLVAPDANLSDSEIDNLIFAPGFSTADAITDVSGRGVGMDVVRQSISALGGRVSISSTPGKGSHFSVSLPLTLAVLDGMVVNCNDQTLVIPVSAVFETMSLKPSDIQPIGSDRKAIRMRNSMIPVIDIRSQFGKRSNENNADEFVALVVEDGKSRTAAILVDNIDGQQQVVIKSLEANYMSVAGIAAATIMGNGEIALILDIDHILDQKSVAPITDQEIALAG